MLFSQKTFIKCANLTRLDYSFINKKVCAICAVICSVCECLFTDLFSYSLVPNKQGVRNRQRVIGIILQI